MVIGMSIAYLASFAGLCLAWWSYRRRRGDTSTRSREDRR